MNHHSFFLKLLASTVLTLGANMLWQASAIASGNLSITPITWDIIGLDSNKVTVGPDTFMVGARVCNTGADPATNVVVKFNRTGTSNPYINLQYSNTLSIASLPAGTSTAAQTRPPNSYGSTPSNCSDFYYNLVITRDPAAYNTTQPYYIQASADNAALVTTPANRQLYVEKLVSQNRNAVASITGPTTVMVGQTYQYTVTGSTATGGYEQLVFSPNFPNVIFQVVGVSATYTSPSGANNNSIYADACGWTNDFTSSLYHNNLECTDTTIPDGYAGGKAGNNVSTVYTVKILSAGSATITNLIYDFSGSSYHYNSDFGTGINTYTVTAVNAPDLTIAKSHTGNFTQGTTNTYNLSVSNVAAAGSGATSGTVTVTDTLPTGLTPTAATGTGWSCAIAGQTVTCTRSDALNPGASYPSISLTVAIAANAPSSLTNTASVAGGSEVNTANNSASDLTTINPALDLTISKTHTGNFNQGQTGATYTLTATNIGSASTTGAVTITDTVPTGLTPTAVTGTGWNCSITGQTITCTRSDALAASASYPPVTLTVSVASNAPTSLTNVASVAGGGEVNATNNSASDPTTINSLPDLTITKTHTGTFTQGTTRAYTLTITNSGTAASSGTVTVSDTVPTGLTPTAASGTGWACSIAGQTLTCTRSDALAALSSYPPITLTVSVAANAPASVTNTATVSGGNDGNTSNNSSSDPTTIVPAGAVPQILLVKRITAVNGVNITTTVDDPGSTNDNAANWPTPIDATSGISTYLKGAINGGTIKPGDLIEYTIYFLSNGGAAATNISLCDLVPSNSTFVPDAFSSLPESGINLTIGATSTNLTNVPDSDGGQFFNAGATPSVSCSTANTNGAVVVNVVKSPANLPNAIAPGTPNNSYGFIRFRARVN